MRYLSLQRYTIQPIFPNAVHLQTKTLRFFNIRISLDYIWSYKKTGHVGRHGENSFYSSFYRYSVGGSPSSILYLYYIVCNRSKPYHQKPKFLFRPYGNRFKVLPSVFLQNGNELTPHECRKFQGLALKMSSADIGVSSYYYIEKIDVLGV